MTRVRFQVDTSLSPDAVLAALTDFGPGRSQKFANIDSSHFTVHELVPGSADVTEGNRIAWERSRYAWSGPAEPLTVTTLESNTWKPGSRWEYRFVPTPAGGTRVQVDVLRSGRGVRGRLLEPLIAVLGSRILRADLRKVLASRRRAGSQDP